MIQIISKKRQKNLQMLRIFRIDEEDADSSIQFEMKYGEYKNIYNKISSYEFICQDYQFYQLLKNFDKNTIRSFIINKINTIQNDAKELNISSDIYDYLNENQINEILTVVDSAIDINLVDYLYQACFINTNKKINIKRKRIY